MKRSVAISAAIAVVPVEFTTFRVTFQAIAHQQSAARRRTAKTARGGKTQNPERGRGRYRVRWSAAGREHHRSFPTRAPAEEYLSQLRAAYRRGEPFDIHTGLPVGAARAKVGTGWLSHAREYAAMQWPHSAPSSRRSLSEGLVTITMALLNRRRAGAPPAAYCRRVLSAYAFRPQSVWRKRPSEKELAALNWMEKACAPVHALSNPKTVRVVLNACALKLDGTPAAASTIHRKRSALSVTCGYALELGLLIAPPLRLVRWRAPAVAESVDRRAVASPRQVRQLLAAVSTCGAAGERLEAFFACLYYAALRPCEAKALRVEDCYLPARGWGRLVLWSGDPKTGAAWTDNGETHEPQGLKSRADQDTRDVPIPPVLVKLLRAHLRTYGAGPGGRVFTNTRGNLLQQSNYGRFWHMARDKTFTPGQLASPLARRPYDLRHAGITV